jgi:lysophospholipase L1-like esterase
MSTQKFKLTLAAKPSDNKINYPNKIMLVGSCFSENMGAKFQHLLFDTYENGHGILFNPVSVQNAIFDYINNKQYASDDLFLLNDVWNSWHHHSRFSGITQQEALTKINSSINNAHLFLKKANYLIVTLGSAWLYSLNEKSPSNPGIIVANNHKAPADWFTKKLMNVQDLTSNLKSLVHHLKSFNPHLNIIFTISPVRHLREGLIENNRSKAVLIQAVHEVIHQEKGVEYFPAYEYVIDDLRDYRFYAEDLVHPNYAATNYVWEKFVETYMSNETQNMMKQIAELQLAKQHKPFFAGSSEHQKFIQSCIEKTAVLINQYPFLSLHELLHFFKDQIVK